MVTLTKQIQIIQIMIIFTRRHEELNFLRVMQFKGTCLPGEMSERPPLPQVFLVWMELHGMASQEKEDPRVQLVNLDIPEKQVLLASLASVKWQHAWQRQLTLPHDSRKLAQSRDRPLKTVKHQRYKTRDTQPFLSWDINMVQRSWVADFAV